MSFVLLKLWVFYLNSKKKNPGKSEQCIQDIVLLLNYKKKQDERFVYNIYIYRVFWLVNIGILWLDEMYITDNNKWFFIFTWFLASLSVQCFKIYFKILKNRMYWLIDFLVFNTNFNIISVEQILYLDIRLGVTVHI